MTKGFWDFMSDWMNATAFRYVKIDEKTNKKRKFIQLIKGNQQIVIDVDDYKILDEEEIRLLK